MKLKTTKDETKEKKGFDLQEFVNTLNTLDPQNIGSWPLAAKVLVYIIVFILVLVLGYIFDLSSMRETYASGEQEQETLLQEFEQKVFKANNLDVYKKQLADMEESFGSLLKQLPKETEVPELLEDVTHTGLGSGLEFDGITLGNESVQEFYVEQPITIKVQGDYHAFGAFVSGISALPRIVTLHNFTIAPLPNKFADSGAPVLGMEVQAKTYRYKDASDNKDSKKAGTDTNSANKAGGSK